MEQENNFLLKMKDGASVGTLEELRIHLDDETIFRYYLNGQLEKWLTDIGHDELANEVSGLSVYICKELRKILEEKEFFRRNRMSDNLLKKIAVYEEIAKRGDVKAMVALGQYYEIGNAKEKAFEWFKKAAELDNPEGMCELGLCYEDGYGTQKDEQMAFEWYKRSAELGNTDAMYNLGKCYNDAVGTEADEEKAVVWYKKSAELGNAEGMYELALCYESGYGVEKDLRKAFDWYKKASELGCDLAEFAVTMRIFDRFRC